MFQNIWKDLKVTKQNFTLFTKEEEKDKDIKIKDLKSQTFASDVYTFMKTPRVIQKWFWTWTAFAIYASIKFLVMIPFDIVRMFVGIVLSTRGYISKYSSWCSIMLVINLLIFNLDIKIFDISYLYHAFRGQSALKFYGLLFAFEIFQKLLTMIGKKVLSALNAQMEQNTNIFLCSRQIMCSFFYIIIHTLSIHLQFICFIVILNSDISSFVIYFFVVNLTKMKSTAFKKMDDKGYSSQINYDMKDRFQKIVYIVMFVCSQSLRGIDQYNLKLFLLLNVGTLIEWVKHLTIHNLTQKQIDIQTMRQKIVAEVGNERIIGPMKCLSIDYTLLPLMTFCLKMIMVIIDSTNTSTSLVNFAKSMGIVGLSLGVLPVVYGIIKHLMRIFMELASDE